MPQGVGKTAFNVCFVHYALQASVSLPPKANSVSATTVCGGLRCFGGQGFCLYRVIRVRQCTGLSEQVTTSPPRRALPVSL